MALAAFARKFFGTTSDRQVKRYQGKVAAINALEPELAGRFRRGLFFAGEAHLDPRAATLALAERLRAGGAHD